MPNHDDDSDDDYDYDGVVLISESLPCSTSLHASLPAFMIRLISQHHDLDSHKKK
jgi:hypothetical protein